MSQINFLGSTIFTTLYLKTGYWQVEMVKECKTCTAFTCGFYECETMPFGATNVPAAFHTLMDNCLGNLNMSWCIVYLDGIIVFSQDASSHVKRLEAVFQKLVKCIGSISVYYGIFDGSLLNVCSVNLLLFFYNIVFRCF